MIGFLTFFALLLIAIIAFLIGLINRNRKIINFSYVTFLGCFILFSGFLLGAKRGYKLHQETEIRGDIILDHVQQYKNTNQACPRNLKDLAVDIPNPALKKTNYNFIEEQGVCGIQFDSTSWLTCRKTITQGNWECRD